MVLSTNPQDVVAQLLSHRPNDSLLTPNSDLSLSVSKILESQKAPKTMSHQEHDESEDATTRTGLITESLLMSSARPAASLETQSQAAMAIKGATVRETPPPLESFKELELSKIDVNLSALLSEAASFVAAPKSSQSDSKPTQVNQSTSYSLVTVSYPSKNANENLALRQRLQKKDTSIKETQDRQDMRIKAKFLREFLKNPGQKNEHGSPPTIRAAVLPMERFKEDQGIQTEDTKEQEIIENSLNAILQIRQDRDRLRVSNC